MVCASGTAACVRMCVHFSPVLSRASLIGSQTRGISVLHNRVGRHREDGPRDSLGALEYTTLLLYGSGSRGGLSPIPKQEFDYHDRMNRTSPCIHSPNSYMPQTW